MTAWLALLESNTSGTGRLFARAAREQGYRPVLLSEDPSRYKYAQEDRLDVLQLDTSKIDVVLAECRRLAVSPALAGITSSSEYFVASAASVAARLRLPGPPAAAIRLCRDKWRQRVCLKAAGVGVPEFRCAASTKQAIAFAADIGFPVIVKPVKGTGSAGVRLCENREQVASHAGALLRQRCNERGQSIPRRVLIEQLAVGPEFSVETFGKQVIGITRKHLGPLPHFVELGHDYPAVVSDEDRENISDVVHRALEALNLSWGPAHVELRVTPDGPKIIEVNPRLAGGYIPELVRLASGIDLISATIAQAVGAEPDLKEKFRRYASVRFISPPADGKLTRIKGLERARSVDGIAEVCLYRKAGERVRRHGDFRDRIGHSIAVGQTPAAAYSASELARSRVQPVVSSN